MQFCKAQLRSFKAKTGPNFYDMLAVIALCLRIVKTTMALSKAEQVARLVQKAGVFRPREPDRVGIPRQYLR
jgi:hypothetical protein